MICFVILNYIAFKQTTKAVDRVRSLTGNKKIIIVENGSPNESATFLEQQYKDIEEVVILKNKKNVGFAKGNNIGYSFAKKQYNPDFIVVMNSDVEILQNDFENNIIKSFEKNKFFILGPDIITAEGGRHQNPQHVFDSSINNLRKMRRKLILKNRLKFFFWIRWKLFKNIKANRIIKANNQVANHVIEDVQLHGSFYVFSKLFIEKNNNCFYSKTFMYMEAQILYFLAKKYGYKMIFDPSIKVIHIDDVSTNLTFNTRYKKAVFSNKALLQSVNAFIDLINK